MSIAILIIVTLAFSFSRRYSGETLLLQVSQHAVDPSCGGPVIIGVAIDAWIKPGGAVTLQRGVEVTAALAEVIVSRVAEGEYGKSNAAKIEAVAVHYFLPKRRGVVGWFAVAVSTCHDQQIVRLGERV